MGDEHEDQPCNSRLELLDHKTGEGVIDILRHVYNGGYSSKQQRMTFEERRALRAKAYRALKALGVEK